MLKRIQKILQAINTAIELRAEAWQLNEELQQLRDTVRKFQAAAKDGKIDPQEAKSFSADLTALASFYARLEGILKRFL